MKPITDDTIKAIYQNLKDFGYGSLTLEHVTTSVNAVATGAKPQGIIQMFAADMLRKNSYLDSPQAPAEGKA